MMSYTEHERPREMMRVCTASTGRKRTIAIVYSCLNEDIVFKSRTTIPPPSTVSIVRAKRFGVIASKSCKTHIPYVFHTFSPLSNTHVKLKLALFQSTCSCTQSISAFSSNFIRCMLRYNTTHSTRNMLVFTDISFSGAARGLLRPFLSTRDAVSLT